MDIGSNVDNHSSNSSFQEIGLEEFRSPNQDDGDDHDQLPNVDEYKASQRVNGTSTTLLKARLTMGILIMIGCIMIMSGIAVGNRKNKARGINDGYNAYHAHLTPRGQDIATFVVNMGWAKLESTKNSFSSQSKAINWLAEEDPLKLEISLDIEFMQRYVLATIFYALNGQNWAAETNFLTAGKTCQWNNYVQGKSDVSIEIGVSCRGEESIKQIFLPKMGLHGDLPEEISLLLSLEELNLFQNYLIGPIPHGWKKLMSLKHLILHDNRLTGNLPDWLPSLPLITLNLATNRFVGEVPVFEENELPEPHLTVLSLERNSFTGDLTFLDNLHLIRAIYLGNNKFGGPLTEQFLGHFQLLEVLDVSDNALTGPLPAALFAMDSLVVADLHGNTFSGRIPEYVELGSYIRFLALHDNSISGTIGGKLNMLSQLEHLDLSRNFFSGTMPSEFGELKNLRYLYLAFNVNLQPGPIPSSFATLPLLKDLSLQKTNRTGEIPFKFLEDSELEMLDLNDNMLTGEIPDELSRLSNLKFLLLKKNKLNGSIPTQLGRLHKLNTLLLDDNEFTGNITQLCLAPSSFGVLTTFIADCGELSTVCECCSKCCRDDDMTCNEVVWFSGLDPIAEGNYGRSQYDFQEADIVYNLPAEDLADIPDYYKNFSGYSLMNQGFTGLPP